MHKKSVVAWWTWSLAVLFLFYEFFVRVYPSIMTRELMEAFKTNAGQLGTLSAFFFYAYAPMQIPVGLLMDRFGARKLLTFAALFCGIGSFFFGMAGTLPPAEFGRFLMGVGSSFAFVGMIYVCSHWFPPQKLALLVGVGNSIGMLGAVGAEGPFSFAVEAFGWRGTVNAFGFIGIALAVILFVFIRKEPEQKKRNTQQESIDLLRNLKTVASNPKTWLNAVIALLFYMTTAAFASLWGIPFLVESYTLSKSVAGFAVSMIFVGWIVGGPIIGHISDHFKRRKPYLYASTLLCCASIVPVIYLTLPLPAIFILLFLTGFFQAAQLLNFSLGIELNPIEAKGTSIALTNFTVAVGTSLMQPLLGVLLDLRWSGAMKNGVPLYSLSDYHFAMLSFPITLLLAFILLFFLKEKEKKKDKTFWNRIIGMD